MPIIGYKAIMSCISHHNIQTCSNGHINNFHFMAMQPTKTCNGILPSNPFETITFPLLLSKHLHHSLNKKQTMRTIQCRKCAEGIQWSFIILFK